MRMLSGKAIKRIPLNPKSQHFNKKITREVREHSGSVVECLTRDQRAVGSSLTGVTALWSLSKAHLS